MPGTLSLYIVRRLLTSIAVTYLILFSIIYLIDFVEVLQRASGDSTIFDVILLGLQRTPIIAEEVFPFIVLFGSIAAFVSLSRRMELVVARATGVSIWQMVAPALLGAAFLGIAVTAFHNPVATYLKEKSIAFQAAVFGRALNTSGGLWLRQRSDDDQSIIRAAASRDKGRSLAGVTAFIFTPEGALKERVDSAEAVLRNGYWEMASARVVRPGSPPQSHDVYRVGTNLTPDQIAETIATPGTISFWELPRVITQWDEAGIRTEKFRLRYQELMARPLVYATMVLIAATVSLGFARFGGLGKAILGGVIAGFMLYVGGEMAGDLGAAGFIVPFVAAWVPSAIGVLLSVTVLLYQEDG